MRVNQIWKYHLKVFQYSEEKKSHRVVKNMFFINFVIYVDNSKSKRVCPE